MPATALPMRAIICEGPDATSFLEGQVTAKVSDLQPNQWRWAAHCNAKGRMHSLLQIVRFKDDLVWLIATEQNAEYAMAQLAKYAVFSKLTMSLAEQPFYGVIDCNDLTPGTVQSGDHTELHLTASTMLTTDENAANCNATQWHQAWVSSGMPWMTEALVGELIPQYIDLDLIGGIAFNKGCYQGQEVIARLHFKGKSKKVRALAPCQEPKLVDDQGRKRAILLSAGSPSLYLVDERNHTQLFTEDNQPVDLQILSPIRD